MLKLIIDVARKPIVATVALLLLDNVVIPELRKHAMSIETKSDAIDS